MMFVVVLTEYAFSLDFVAEVKGSLRYLKMNYPVKTEEYLVKDGSQQKCLISLLCKIDYRDVKLNTVTVVEVL